MTDKILLLDDLEPENDFLSIAIGREIVMARPWEIQAKLSNIENIALLFDIPDRFRRNISETDILRTALKYALVRVPVIAYSSIPEQDINITYGIFPNEHYHEYVSKAGRFQGRRLRENLQMLLH